MSTDDGGISDEPTGEWPMIEVLAESERRASGMENLLRALSAAEDEISYLRAKVGQLSEALLEERRRHRAALSRAKG